MKPYYDTRMPPNSAPQYNSAQPYYAPPPNQMHQPPPQQNQQPPQMQQTQSPPYQQPAAQQYQPAAQQYQPPSQQYQPPPQQYHQPSQLNQPPHQMQQPPTQLHQPPPPSQMHQPPPPQLHQQSQPQPQMASYPSVPELINNEMRVYQNSDRVISFNAPASLPPLPATLENRKIMLYQQDTGCARACHMRSTIYQVPTTRDILDTSGIEFAVVMKPFDDGEVEGRFYVPLSDSEIIRCNRCKAYANPFSKNGHCCICNFTIFGMREPDQKPELNLGSYEFRVTPEYYRGQLAETRRPHIVFAIEMTVSSRHLVHYLSKNLADVIKTSLPTDFLYSTSITPLVGFVTYNSKITVYDVLNGGHAYIVSDIDSVAECASTSSFLVDPSENFDAIQKFLESLTDLCSEQLETEQQTVLGPVIDIALKTCLHDVNNFFGRKPNHKVIPTGKIYLFHSSLPTSGDDSTPGRLNIKRNIDDLKRQLGTETEFKALNPEGKFYSSLAQKCVNNYATGVELFLFPPNPRAYQNIATIGDMAHLTGTGIIHKYHMSSLNNFKEDLKFSLKSTMAFDASIKVRTSTGISPVRYIGHVDSASSNLEMAAVNTNSNFIVQMKYDDKIPENDLVVVQFAMIYTSVCGERRVRVHNLALTACQSMHDLYRMVCCDTLVNVMVRDVIDKMRCGTLNPKTAKEQLVSKTIHILTSYRKHCTDNQTSLSQLILPEALKLLPMYLCGAMKCDAIDGGYEMFLDDKVLAQFNLLGALPFQSQVTFYPRLYSIEACDADDEDNEHGLTATQVRCTYLLIDQEQAPCYVLENGHYLFVYFTSTELGQQFLSSVYGQRKDDPDLSWDIRQQDNNETKFLESLVDQIVAERRHTLQISVIRQGRDKLENVFRTFLFEDKKRHDGAYSKLNNIGYAEMLVFLHGEVRSKLTQ